MRSIPFKNIKPEPATTSTPSTEPPQLQQRSFASSVVQDLSNEIRRPAAPLTKPEVKPEETTDNGPQTTEETPPATPSTETSSATLTTDEMREKVDKFKEKMQGEMDKTIADPKRAAKHALQIINFIRCFAYPFLYKKILFAPAEIDNINAILKKKGDAGMKGEEAKFNAYEQEMLKKWDFFQKHSAKVQWSAKEVELMAEIGYAQLAEIKFFRWLMQNEWAIVIIIIEGPRWAPIAAHKMGFGEMDTDGLLSIVNDMI